MDFYPLFLEKQPIYWKIWYRKKNKYRYIKMRIQEWKKFFLSNSMSYLCFFLLFFFVTKWLKNWTDKVINVVHLTMKNLSIFWESFVLYFYFYVISNKGRGSGFSLKSIFLFRFLFPFFRFFLTSWFRIWKKKFENSWFFLENKIFQEFFKLAKVQYSCASPT